MQPRDMVIPAGRRLGLMVLSSDRDYTVRPAGGTELTLDLANSSFTLPTVGGSKAAGRRSSAATRRTAPPAGPSRRRWR